MPHLAQPTTANSTAGGLAPDAEVTLAGRDEQRLAAAGQELPGRVRTVRYDALEVSGHQPFVAGIFAQGPLDLVISAAGILVPQEDCERDVRLAATMIETNFTGHVSTLLAVAAGMRAQGRGTIVDGLTITATLGAAGPFQLKLARDGSNWLVAGQSLAGDAHTERLLLYGEFIAGPFVLLAMFFGSLAVRRRALAPVEQSRRRQLEFTADASHELRTPLSVIKAEADVALASPREAAEYRDALARIEGESRRLRQLVDDMLWLARFDSRPPPPGDEPVDLVTLAQACADRFRAVGPAITVETGTAPVLISAPPEWIDRLAGVLVDNACRHAGADGQVRIGVQVQGSRVSLIVEDSGPGIRPEDRSRLFDRFHRATEHGPGAGLGLAIGDSIVRSTGGRWHLGDSPLGGALMAVSWRHAQPHRPSVPRMTTSNA
jgi:signal transduction histidine kinase